MARRDSNKQPTYESDLEKASVEVSNGMSEEDAVAAILADWEVDPEDVQAHIRQRVEELKAEAEAKAAKKDTPKKSGDTVTVTVPKAFKLRLDHNTELKFEAGIQEMDPKVAEHWFAKANGVEVYQPK